MSKKGPAFERKICTMLSEWWTNGDREDVFWRTSQSGGRATTRGKKGKETKGQCGDIAATDPIGNPLLEIFTLELKRGYSSYSPFDLIDRGPNSKSKTYIEWIEKIEKTSKKAGSASWMLIVKRDKREPFVLMPRYIWDRAVIKYYFPSKAFAIRVDINENIIDICGTTLIEFFEKCTPEIIINLSEMIKKENKKT